MLDLIDCFVVCCLIAEAPFGKYLAEITHDGRQETLEVEAILNATGRVPNLKNLNLSLAGIDAADGVQVDEHLRTRNPDVFAAGDCLPGNNRFTHAAEWQARVAVRNAFLFEGLDARKLLVPRATYTDPEVASVGRSAAELRTSEIVFETFTRQAKDVDRNRCDGIADGFASLHVAPNGQILGATVVGPHLSCVTKRVGKKSTRRETVRFCFLKARSLCFESKLVSLSSATVFKNATCSIMLGKNVLCAII